AIVGPVFGGIIAARGSIQSVFLFIAGLFIFTARLKLKFVKESIVASERNKVRFRHFLRDFKQHILLQASVATFALMVRNETLAFAMPIKVDELGMTSETTGVLLSIFGIIALIVFLTPINRVYDHFQPISLVLFGIILIGVSLFMLSYLSSFSSSVLAMIVYG